MAFTPEILHRKARRSYELGRLRVAVPWAILVGSVGLLGTAVTGAGVLGIGLALFAAAAACACLWYGRQLGRGVWPGVWVGTLGLVLALVAWVCVGRGATSFFECRLPCVLAGFVIAFGGVYRGNRSASANDDLATLAGTVLIAAPLALIACIGVGVGGIAGLTAGLTFGSAPAILRALRPHSSG
jgi:hypothetical protein